MDIQGQKGVALNPKPYIHLTDHLAPIAVLMDIPLLITTEEHTQQACALYPGLRAELIDWDLLTPDYLIEHFDVFFQSQPWDRQRFYDVFEPLEKKYQKEVRNVHCPHGFSDKVYWLNQCVLEDITLVYGDNMLDMFKQQGLFPMLNAYVKVGNYRYTYYRQYQAFFDQIVQEQIFNRFAKKQPTILYAPTWCDYENNSSFLDADPFFKSLPSEYNLLVKLHPMLEEMNSPALYYTMGHYEDRGNIVFVKDCPLVYPILAQTDIYLGDMSSISYDFLVFNRPMFFLNQLKRDLNDRNAFVFRCGVSIDPAEYSQVYSIIEKHLKNDRERFSDIRSAMYQYTFGSEVPFDQIRKAIEASYTSPKKR